MQFGAVDLQVRQFERRTQHGTGLEVGLEVARRTAGQKSDLERAAATVAIVRVQPIGGDRVERPQACVEFLVGQGAHLAARRVALGVGGLDRVEALAQGAQVEARAAHEQRHVTAIDDPHHRLLHPLAVLHGVGGVGRVDDVDQVMGDLGALGRRGLARTHVEAAVELARIEDDDLDLDAARAQAAGDLDRRAGLAGGGGADQAEQGGIHRRPKRRSSSGSPMRMSVGRPCGQL